MGTVRDNKLGGLRDFRGQKRVGALERQNCE